MKRDWTLVAWQVIAVVVVGGVLVGLVASLVRAIVAGDSVKTAAFAALVLFLVIAGTVIAVRASRRLRAAES